jgi:hypothetical protein
MSVLRSALYFCPLAATSPQTPSSERASAFIAGPERSSESFGELQGTALLGTAVLAILIIFIFLYLQGKKSFQNRSRLLEIMADLEKTDDNDF